MDKNTIQQTVYGLLRTLLAGVGGTLILKGYLNTDQWGALLGGIAALLVAGGFSLYNKLSAQKREEAAKKLPPTATSDDVTKAVKLAQG
jgi:hypothetical protein